MKFVPTCCIFLYLLFPHLAQSQNSPGGVQNDLHIWLRTDNDLIQNGGGAYNWLAINDVNMNAIQTTASKRPAVMAEEINGHSVVRFDGEDQWMQFNDAATALSGDCSVFFVINPDEDSDVAYYLATHSGSSDLMKFGHKLSGQLTYDNSIPAFWPYDMHGQKTLMTFQAEENFYLDSYVNAFQAPPWTYNFQNSGADAVSIGKANGSDGSTAYWKGDIAEIIIYDRFLTAAELDAVHTYLNIRYGITIPVEHHNYYNHTSYSENIAGIGMENSQLLDQTNSRNENDQNVVRIESPDDLTNGEYLVWGNDGATLNITNMDKPAIVEQRITREWRVQETGEVGLTTLSFDLAEIGFAAVNDPTEFALLISDNNANFTTADFHVAGRTIANGQIIFTDVDLQDGDWFTLAVALAPCTNSGFSITSGTPYAGQPVGLSVNVIDPLATYTWSFGGGAIPATATGLSVSTTWNFVGNFPAELTISYPHCDDFVSNQSIFLNEPPIQCADINLQLWLEGPYNAASGTMNTTLNDRGLLPGQTPISTLPLPTPPGQPYSIQPWNLSDTTGQSWTDNNYTADIIDWVLISFRIGLDKSTEVARGVGLINSDGEVTVVDACLLQNTTTPLHIVVEHRNHTAVMTAAPILIVNGEMNFDFRNAGANATIQKAMPNGVYALYAGDGSQTQDLNGYDVNGVDKELWDMTNGIFDQYIPSDFNLDGNVDGADRSIWSINNGESSGIDRN